MSGLCVDFTYFQYKYFDRTSFDSFKHNVMHTLQLNNSYHRVIKGGSVMNIFLCVCKRMFSTILLL